MAFNKICFFQINLHHCQAASYNLNGELGKVHQKNQHTIVLVQEPWQNQWQTQRNEPTHWSISC